MLLSADVGHFSLVRAMHLADLITLMNGGFPLPLFLFGEFLIADVACDAWHRLLRCHVDILVLALVP